MPENNDVFLNKDADVTKQEWESYSRQVNKSVSQLASEVGSTVSDMGEDVNKEWVYHSPKLKNKAKNLGNDIRQISDEIRERLTE